MSDTLVAGGITVRVNGDERAIPAGLTVDRLLEHLSLNPRMVVVERNCEILRRELLAETIVHEGDSLELVHFVGGG
ncbi:MAG TPA: sulfur carrier protein ThiS [Longimicrobium sp.]|jgi:thiamine biosynthesis protein ThiS|uniref:sulfur carrier protein ThiS n=1 Tax=Longimicrobium sp. TaxID=2029185 RepID=UPI002EDB425A